MALTLQSHARDEAQMNRTAIQLVLVSILLAKGPFAAASICTDLSAPVEVVKIPDDFDIFEVDPKVLERFRPTQLSDQNERFQDYVKGGKTLRKEFNRLSKDNVLDQIDSVAYPASGTDSPFPYLLFPNARVVIAIDKNPFATKTQTGFSFQKTEESLDYRNYIDIGDSKSLGSAILSNMARTIPNFALKRVLLFGPQGQRRHAFVEFDQGEGKPNQYFIFVSDHANKVEPQWWHTAIGSHLAILVKGAMGFPLRFFWNSINQARTPETLIAVGSSQEIGSYQLNVTEYATKKVLIGYARRDYSKTLLLRSK